MKIESTLAPLIERWEDPGCYPNGAASGPLPSYNYLAAIEGEVVIEWGPDEPEPELSLLYDIAQEECAWCQVERWNVTMDCAARRAILDVAEFDERTAHDPDWEEDDGDRKYDEWRDRQMDRADDPDPDKDLDW